jgi:hypothetical protein
LNVIDNLDGFQAVSGPVTSSVGLLTLSQSLSGGTYMSFWQKLIGRHRSAARREVSTSDGLTTRAYSLNVNFDIPVEEMVKRGAYQYVESGARSTAFTAANYPSTQTGALQLQVHLMPFQGVSIKDALNELNATNYQPATLHELLAFGEQYPDVQLRFSIVAPGTQIETHPGYFSVPRLGVGGLGRVLDIQPITHNMGGQQWMLAAVAI